MVLVKSKIPVSTTKKEVSVIEGAFNCSWLLTLIIKLLVSPCQVGLFKKSPSEKSSINWAWSETYKKGIINNKKWGLIFFQSSK